VFCFHIVCCTILILGVLPSWLTELLTVCCCPRTTMNDKDKRDDDDDDDDGQQQQIRTVLQLLKARAAGQATDADVEGAVQCILGSPVVTIPSKKSTSRTRTSTSTSTPIIHEDSDDYDDTHDSCNETKETRHHHATPLQAPTPLIDPSVYYDTVPGGLGLAAARMIRAFGDLEPHPNHKNHTHTTTPTPTNGTTHTQQQQWPLVETVLAVLHGTRRMLHVAIQDARQVRRQRQRQYAQAQAVLKQQTKKKSNTTAVNTTNSNTTKKKRLVTNKTTTTTTKDAAANLAAADATNNNPAASTTTTTTSINDWSPDVLYRVHAGYDRLAYHPKCGFDVEELQQLYAEEMNAYARWSFSYQAYSERVAAVATTTAAHAAHTQKRKTDEAVTANGEDVCESGGGDDEPDKDENDNDHFQPTLGLVGGHLQQRAAQFDIRTDRMKDARVYMEFAELRRGSFLPRTAGRNSSSSPTVTQHEDALWCHLPPAAVRFLHWIGFDPAGDDATKLAPPSLETTRALAFLAHDFFGRIVEKAIELRVDVRHDSTSSAFLELPATTGVQLQPLDVERAMQDVDIRPVPLYGKGTNEDGGGCFKPGPQLYFGPGFEHRLEMELEEFMKEAGGRSSTAAVAGCKKNGGRNLSQEDLRIQKEEEELFARLA
jgi:hypothetical protein